MRSSSEAVDAGKSRIAYTGYVLLDLPKSQITRLQQIQNYLERAVVKAPKFYHITPILRSLQRLRNE